MFRVPVDGTADIILCDDQSVVNNSSKIDSTLDKNMHHSFFSMFYVRIYAEVITFTVRKLFISNNHVCTIALYYTINHNSNVDRIRSILFFILVIKFRKQLRYGTVPVPYR